MSSNGCAPPAGGPSLVGRDVTREAIIQGTVQRDQQPVANAYVRLLDSAGEFTAEVPTNDRGEFRFFAGDGQWNLRALAPRAAVVDLPVTAAVGSITEVTITV
jgi:hypothetical protein